MIGWGARLVLSTRPQFVMATKEGSPILPQLSAKVKMLLWVIFIWVHQALAGLIFKAEKQKPTDLKAGYHIQI
jgi:hypothetical protein